MRIAHAASELFPYLKTGGLADAVAALTGTLADRGHELADPGDQRVRVGRALDEHAVGAEVREGAGSGEATKASAEHDDVRFFLAEHRWVPGLVLHPPQLAPEYTDGTQKGPGHPSPSFEPRAARGYDARITRLPPRRPR